MSPQWASPDTHKGRVLAWLEKQEPGTEFYYGKLASDLGVQKPNLSNILLGLVRAEPQQLDRGRVSGWYRVIGPAAPEQPVATSPQARVGELMEVVGVRKDGKLLFRADDHTMWEASEI